MKTLATAVVVMAAMAAAAAQSGSGDRTLLRVQDRVRVLQSDVDRLAARTTVLQRELQPLEQQRASAAERVATTEAALDTTRIELEATVAALEQRTRTHAETETRARNRLVELYKQGRGGYLRLLLGAGDLRELGRALRAVTSLAHVDQARLDEDQAAIAGLSRARTEGESRIDALTDGLRQARQARSAAGAAVARHRTELERVTRQQGERARWIADLAAAERRLAAGGGATEVGIPMAAFRGALDWPVAGRLVPAPNGSGPAGPGGVTIAGQAGATVSAVHGGTVAAVEAATETAGAAVTIDHGDGHRSRYGGLATSSVASGQRLQAGDPIGVLARGASGEGTLGLAILTNGQPSDPVEWLQPR